MRHLYALCALTALVLAGPAVTAQITVANSGGLWSDPTTWSTGAVPTATDDVVIADSSVTIDIPVADGGAVARNVTIMGEGTLRTNRGFETNTPVGLTVFGDLTIVGSDAQLLPLSNQDPDTGVGYGEIYHSLTVHGDIDNSTGGTFDMRRGSTSTNPASAAFIDLVFAGGEDSTLELGPYDNDDNQLFRTEIAKTGGAKVTMLSDATIDNNSRATFTLTSGYLDTGDHRFTLISNNSSVVVGGSPASYVIGELARGLPKGTPSSQTSRSFPVGDANAFRPATVYVTDRPSDDQVFGVRVVAGDADPGASSFSGGLTDVSPVRSFAFTWYEFDTSESIDIDAVEISYGADDMVPAGSTDFVVATSTDDRMSWVNSGAFNPDDSAHTTSLASPPTPIKTMMLTGWTFDIGFNVNTLEFEYDTHHAAMGTTSSFGGASVRGGRDAEALQFTAAPNPTTGAARVGFVLHAPVDVTVEVFDVLGRRVATLADGPRQAGPHEVTWDAHALAAGLYHVRLHAGTVVAAQTISVAR